MIWPSTLKSVGKEFIDRVSYFIIAKMFIHRNQKGNCHFKYCIAPDKDGYRVLCVGVKDAAFQNRLSLPIPWRGLRDQALAEVCDVPDATFVHIAGFIGGAKSLEGAIKMAVLALSFTE